MDFEVTYQYISNTRDSVSSGYPKTKKTVENSTLSGAEFLTKFEVFGEPMKHCFECFMTFDISSKTKKN